MHISEWIEDQRNEMKNIQEQKDEALVEDHIEHPEAGLSAVEGNIFLKPLSENLATILFL